MTVTTRSGTVVCDGEVYGLRFDREYRAPIADVWSAITTPERAARWIGELRGTLAVGERVVLMMGEDETERADIDVLECREPHRIAVGWIFPGDAPTRLTVDLSEADPGRTRVRLVHTGWATADEVPGYGCGWHHFIDTLDAYLAGEPLPSFDDYYPALLDEWKERAAELR